MFKHQVLKTKRRDWLRSSHQNFALSQPHHVKVLLSIICPLAILFFLHQQSGAIMRKIVGIGIMVVNF